MSDQPTGSLVCLHGLGRSPSDWDGVRDGLSPYGVLRAPALPRRPDQALAVADAAVDAGAVVVGHSMGGVLAMRLAHERPRPLRAVVLSGCFFAPSRNGRGVVETIGDYAGHRLAFLRARMRDGRTGERSDGSARALASLARLALERGDPGAALEGVTTAVLIVHARDDHHVPVDFALGAAARRPGWTVRVLECGGHHAHVEEPGRWLAAVTPWLDSIGGAR